MSVIAISGARNGARPFDFFQTMRVALRRWQLTRQTRNALAGLSDHELNDIGICRFDIERVSRGRA